MMMYNQKMVASIKVQGKILREIKDNVLLPYGCEYSILLKNINTVRCVVDVFIDGVNMVPGGLVLDAGQTIDLERSVKDGNLTAGNKFKFIERTGAIEDGPRGIKLEDGLVRIEYQFEKYVAQTPFVIKQKWIPGHYEFDKMMFGNQQNINAVWGGLSRSTGISGASGSIASGAMLNQVNVGGTMRSIDSSLNGAKMQAQASAAINSYCAENGIATNEYHSGSATMDWMDSAPKNDVGITVAGSKSTQQFKTTTMGVLEAEKHTIVLKLLGEIIGGEKITEPLTVKAKQKCDTCGTTNKATAHFCSKCGTSLVLYA
jgi:hypothetical protein